MGQQHHKPAHSAPLHVGGANELVDDHLGAVCEVAKLRFPQGERSGFRKAVAVLEAQYRGFGQQAVKNFEARLLFGNVIERRVFLTAVLVDQHRVSVTKRAPRTVLARQADARAFKH